jgi:hypothetical protein
MTVISIAQTRCSILSSDTDCSCRMRGGIAPKSGSFGGVGDENYPAPEVRSETVTLAPAEIGAVDHAAWQELGERAAEPNPFHEPEFMLPAFRRLGLRTAGVRVVREGGDWIACLPVSAAPLASASLVGLWHPYVLSAPR